MSDPDRAPSAKSKSTKTTPYSGNFEQKLIDNGIYPDLHEHSDGRTPQIPANLSDIEAALPVRRASLSPSRFTDEDFRAFRLANTKAKGETTGIYKVLPVITGDEKQP